MMLKSLAVLFFLAVCSALPVDDTKAPLEEGKNPVLGPEKDALKGDSDLKTDATYWGYYSQPYYREYYGSSYIDTPTYYSYWSYW